VSQTREILDRNPFRIGVDLGGTKIEAIVLDRSGGEVARRRIASPRDDYAATLAAARDLVMALETELGVPSPCPVGVGIPGTLSRVTGLVKNANSTWLIGHPFDKDLESALGRPVRVQNDANCFALSEASDGAAAAHGIVFGVILGTGVGAGLTVGGKLVDGPNGITGEWGHAPLPWPTDDERLGPPCYCGRHGCIETFLAGPSLTHAHEAATGSRMAPADIVGSAKAGDPGATSSLTRYVDRLARGLAMVINIVDPDCIVLGGGMSNIADLYLRVPEVWDRYVFSDRVDTALVPPRHGDSSGVRGAAWLWSPDETISA